MGVCVHLVVIQQVHTHKMVPIVIDVEVVGLTADASHPDLVEAWILIDQQGCKVYTLLVNPPPKKIILARPSSMTLVMQQRLQWARRWAPHQSVHL